MEARRRVMAALLTVVIALATLVAVDVAPAAAAPERHCIHPLGFDMNEVNHTNDRIITAFCPVALVGERWIPAGAWTTNTTYEVIPEGYTPLRATPIEDFKAKFVGARYVVDEGTKHERSYSFSASKILQIVSAPGSPFPTASIMPVLPPLPPGAHSVDIFFTYSADHWDGFGAEPFNFWPAGETHCSRVEFTVEHK